MHARARGRDRLDIVDALGGLQDGVDHDRPGDAVLGLELGEKLVEIMDVPGAVDLGQHDDVELVADPGDDLQHVIQRPGAVQRIDAGPQRGGAEIGRRRHLDEAAPSGLLGVGRNRIFKIAEQHVHLGRDIGGAGADLLDMGRDEMDHPLQPHRLVTMREAARRRRGA